MSLRYTLFAAAGAMVAFASSAHAVTFDLAGSAGSTPPFSITSGGVTETYTSPATNGFAVQSTSGLLSFSTALLDNNFFGTDPLTITFSTPQVNQISIPFAIIDALGTGTDTLTAALSNGQSLTFSTLPDSLPLGEPEGLLSVVPTSAITSLTLTSSIAFAVGNTTVPEPMSLALLGTGLVGLAGARVRRANFKG